MRITDYPQLTNVLKDSASITYLCGAGLSMSLGEHNKSWWHWLQAGKSYLNTDDQKKFDLRIGSGSAEEMIAAAGFLLGKLKNASTYDEFMRQEMLSIHPENKEDISALRLMNRAGDFFATTNYDTSIEQVIGIGTATYSEPDKVLAILKRQTDRKVIHLHGAYIPSRGIDDIIADDAQYEAILKNKGAQFLQALIGTNPIIIVGCGGTTKDPNMSNVINFTKRIR
jgi:NAD-dependent SIR2 family protein deacetylase